MTVSIPAHQDSIHIDVKSAFLFEGRVLLSANKGLKYFLSYASKLPNYKVEFCFPVGGDGHACNSAPVGGRTVSLGNEIWTAFHKQEPIHTPSSKTVHCVICSKPIPCAFHPKTSNNIHQSVCGKQLADLRTAKSSPCAPGPVPRAAAVQPPPAPVPVPRVRVARARLFPVRAPRAAVLWSSPAPVPTPRVGTADAQLLTAPVSAPRVRATVTQLTPSPVPTPETFLL